MSMEDIMPAVQAQALVEWVQDTILIAVGTNFSLAGKMAGVEEIGERVTEEMRLVCDRVRGNRVIPPGLRDNMDAIGAKSACEFRTVGDGIAVTTATLRRALELVQEGQA